VRAAHREVDTRLGRRPVRLTATRLADVAHLPDREAARQAWRQCEHLSEVTPIAPSTNPNPLTLMLFAHWSTSRLIRNGVSNSLL